MIYFDNATATPMDERALKEMLPFLRERFASPFAPYSLGQSQVPVLNRQIEELRALIGADAKDHLLISSSTTLSTSAIFFGVWHDIAREYGKNHFLSTKVEEAAKLFGLGRIEELGGITTLINVNSKGNLEPQTLSEELSPRSALLSLSLVNPVLGNIQPMDEIGKICQERGVLLHVDLTHAVGKIDFNLKEMKADLATFSCESIFGPKNCTALWMRQGVRLTPFVLGSEPESIGILDPATLVAFGVSAQEARLKKTERMFETARLRSIFEKKISKEIPKAQILFQDSDRLPCTSVILFPYIAAETLMFAISEKGLYASMGGGTRQEIGHLLAACGIESSLARCGLSFTFSHLNTDEEAIQAAEILAAEYSKYAPLSKDLFHA